MPDFIDLAFADELLRFLLDYEGEEVDYQVAAAMGVPTPKVKDHLSFIFREQPRLVKLEITGYGIVLLVLHRENREAIEYFLQRGGFVELDRRRREDEAAKRAPGIQNNIAGNVGNMVQAGENVHLSDSPLVNSRSSRIDTTYSSTGTNTEKGKGQSWLARNKEWVIAIAVLLLSIFAHLLGLL